ncbi:Uncharacterized protein DUF547 [hydrothermal vent metagenome]|uniref:Uncharacterized protein DUF547 n=1 Tax=hydrothermal vent metagenome TaxID=652676 RepID=A0A3B0WZH4_9ZZZZ
MLSKINHLVIIVFSLFFCFSLQAKSFDWSQWEMIVSSKVISDSSALISTKLLNYQSLLNDQRIKKIYLALQNYDPSKLYGNEKKAFYINAYNFYAVSMVLNHWPIESIRDIGNVFFKVWDKDVGKINGEWVTLNYIEHEVLRPMGDPRIHFAIVCASLSCPDLRTEIYMSNNLDTQLENQTSNFLNNPSKGLLKKRNGIEISKIFKWFENDFDSQGGILNFIEKYQLLGDNIEDVDFLPYNWQLNEYTAIKTK